MFRRSRSATQSLKQPGWPGSERAIVPNAARCLGDAIHVHGGNETAPTWLAAESRHAVSRAADEQLWIIVCSWIGGRFYLAIDSTNDTAELKRLNGAGVLPVVRVKSHDVAYVHFHVSIPTSAARAYRETATA